MYSYCIVFNIKIIWKFSPINYFYCATESELTNKTYSCIFHWEVSFIHLFQTLIDFFFNVTVLITLAIFSVTATVLFFTFSSEHTLMKTNTTPLLQKGYWCHFSLGWWRSSRRRIGIDPWLPGGRKRRLGGEAPSVPGGEKAEGFCRPRRKVCKGTRGGGLQAAASFSCGQERRLLHIF